MKQNDKQKWKAKLKLRNILYYRKVISLDDKISKLAAILHFTSINKIASISATKPIKNYTANIKKKAFQCGKKKCFEACLTFAVIFQTQPFTHIGIQVCFFRLTI